MKTKLIISIFLSLSVFAFVYNSNPNFNSSAKETTAPLPPANNNITDNFIIGSLHDSIDADFSNVNDLGLNLWHTYLGGKQDNTLNRFVPTGWTSSDELTAGISSYEGGVTSMLSNIYSNGQMRSFIQRPKIEWLCFGQRSDYECEDSSLVNSDLFFYTFQSPGHVGSDVSDSGHYVRHCHLNPSGPTTAGMVVSRLKCNTEQSEPCASGNKWHADGDCDWLIKPRIRIDSSYAHNSANLNNNVCKIIVLRKPGDTLKAVDLKVINFFNAGNYDGQYLEEFFNLTDSLKIHGNWGNLFAWRSRGNWATDSTSDSTYRSKVDLQVYWYGNCDMWIDRVRVDNDIADELLNPNNPNHNRDSIWIADEATHIANYNGSPVKFYIELPQFNNIPCIAYVNRKLQSLGAGVDLVHRSRSVSELLP